MSSSFLLVVLCSACFTADVHSEKVLNRLKGSTVVLSPGVVETPITSITWKFGADLAAEWFGGSLTFYSSFKDHCILKTETGELIINDVRLEDGGVFTPEINNKILAAIKLQVFSPVPKPIITHDCKSDKTECTLSCMFDKTDDLRDVEIFWIVDDSRVKEGTEIYITKETKAQTFICSLSDSFSSENSTELQNPLLADDQSGRNHVAVWIILGLLLVAVAVVVVVVLILWYKKHPVIMRLFSRRNGPTPEKELHHSNPVSISTPLLEDEGWNQTSSITVPAEINHQTEPNGINTQGSAVNPDPDSETKPEPETIPTNIEESAETPHPSSSSQTKCGPAAGGDAAQHDDEGWKQTSSITVTAEINHQTESNTPNTQEPLKNPNPAPSSDTKTESGPETNEEAEDPNTDPSEEANRDSGSAVNDLPEADQAEASSGSPDGSVSTSELS